MATLYIRSFINPRTSISCTFKKSTNRISPLFSYKLSSSFKRYYNDFSKPKSTLLDNQGWNYSLEVSEALQEDRPVVALESSIICHGKNLETAIAVENIVRENGSAPATIAILNGKINVGLSSSGLEILARIGQQAKKSSRRDLAYVVSQGLTGGTTVSGTIVIAHHAGIKVFVTGGIGGVHRGAEKSMDISADLVELGKSPVAVVCAGVKSILDIGKTLEYLETQGVTVTTFGETTDFPAFFTRKSGFKSPSNSKTIEECAALINANTQLGLDSGLLIAVPIPENEAADADKVQKAIDIALVEAKDIRGKDVTPFLLRRVNEITQGGSLKSNVALIKHNAKIGSRIAKCLAGFSSKQKSESRSKKNVSAPFFSKLQRDQDFFSNKRLLIIGGAAVDLTSTLDPLDSSYFKTSSPGVIRQTIGGVGRNIAETSFRLGANPLFVSTIGNDVNGSWLKNRFEQIGMETDGLQIIKNESTALYNAIHDPDGNLICAVADMRIFDKLSSDKVCQTIRMKQPKLVCFDGNISSFFNTLTLNPFLEAFFETTSVPKSLKLFKDHEQFISLLSSQSLKYMSPNFFELKTMHAKAHQEGLFERVEFKEIDKYGLDPKFEKVKLGANGILYAQFLKDLSIDNVNMKETGKSIINYEKNEIIIKWKNGNSGSRPKKLDKSEIVNVTGAGDR
ncbi:4676_t:CDS:10 [Funneliformis caledonium]|uniref:4676_t:CDS:1 n=1 Tax=Funneliformis caledonium TaxID=1117310 RepID=A0A9N8ZA97_9GLOM|nr:4676_t:CDS:10 [Funneliformis caledonium]